MAMPQPAPAAEGSLFPAHVLHVHLNALELDIAGSIATLREAVNEVTGVSSRKVSRDYSNWEVHWHGAKGELAFARRYNLYPDFTFEPRSGGVDFHCNGLTMNVKATAQRNGNLICPPPGDKPRASLYVLAIVMSDDVYLWGYATAEALFKPENLGPLYAGGPPTYKLDRGVLRPLRGEELPREFA